MRRFASLLLVVMCCGCAGRSLSDYTSRGTSADAAALKCFQDRMPVILAIERYQLKLQLDPDLFGEEHPDAKPPLTPQEEDDAMRQVAAHTKIEADTLFRHRPAWANFRSLCALLNHYWGNWERLVIIERFTFDPYDYGFVVAGIADGKPSIVTNLTLHTEVSGWWIAGADLHAAIPKLEAFRAVLEELDKARLVLPKAVFYFPNVGCPLYVMHDIKKDGSDLSFGLCGMPSFPEEDKPLQTPDYAEANKLVPDRGSHFKPICVLLDNPDGQQVNLAGLTYALLLAQVWDALLERPDAPFLGQFSLKEPKGP